MIAPNWELIVGPPTKLIPYDRFGELKILNIKLNQALHLYGKTAPVSFSVGQL